MAESKGRVAEEPTNLQKRIQEEMTVSYANVLEKNFELAKNFIRITTEGKIDVLVKNKLTGKEQILLYLIGKMYAKEVGYIPSAEAGNEEMATELGMPKNSLLPWLKDLRDTNRIRAVNKGRYTYHSISINFVEKILDTIEKKMQGKLM